MSLIGIISVWKYVQLIMQKIAFYPNPTKFSGVIALKHEYFPILQIGSRLEKFELQSQDGKEMLSFDLHFKVL